MVTIPGLFNLQLMVILQWHGYYLHILLFVNQGFLLANIPQKFPLLERVLMPSERNWDQLLTILTGYFNGGYFLVCSAAEILQIQKVS